jgi:branched-chain amino acid transport system ATP-binding protein
MTSTMPLLRASGLKAWYGESQALHGVSFDVGDGEVVTLVGRNGAGKTTILKSIMGLMPRATGDIRLKEKAILGLRPDEIAASGIAFCPEERAIFSSLSVWENLLLPPAVAAGGFSIDEIFELFPNLKERRESGGTTLSGGEQQMLAIARILRTGAKLLLLDEPSEGLAPVVVKQIAQTIREIKARGFTVLLVEQNVNFARSISDRYYVVEMGLIIDQCSRADVEAEPSRLAQHLTV